MTQSDRREPSAKTEQGAATAVPGDLEAIVLAAGAGSRFGGGKLMAPWRGGRLIDGALAAAFAAPVRRVIVVVGADPRVAEAATAFAAAHPQGERLHLLWAVDHVEGMGASLRAGVGALAEVCAGAFVFLGDMPLIPPGLAHALAGRLTASVLAVAPVFEGRRGHPVLFAAPLLPALGQAAGDEGARALLAGLGERLVLLPTKAPGVLVDVDRPSDLPRG